MKGRGRGRGKKRQSADLEGQSSLLTNKVPVHVTSPWSEPNLGAGDNEDSQSPVVESHVAESLVGDWGQYFSGDGIGPTLNTDCLNIPHIDGYGEHMENAIRHQSSALVQPDACVDRVQRRTKAGRFATYSDGSCNIDEGGSSRLDMDKKKQIGYVGDTSWIVTSPVSGGPRDVTVIPSYGGHVANDIWQGKERPVLKCHKRHSTCQSIIRKFSECKVPVQDRIRATRLSHLPEIMFQFLDMALISAFVERWQPDTNSFHMPFGEITIMLHDVQCILNIPADGDILGIVGGGRSYQSLQDGCAELFGKDVQTFVREDWRCGGMDGSDLLDHAVVENQTDDFQFLCYMLTLLGSTLFVDKTGVKIRPQPLAILADPTIDVTSLSWGSATLAYLYQHLGMASRADGRQMAGCCTLLQAWIYEYFPMFRQVDKARTDMPSRAWRWYSGDNLGNNLDRLQFFRRALDVVQAHQIEWMPYIDGFLDNVPRTHYRGLIRYFDVVEPYLPDRCVRQLGYMQGIPEEPYRPDHASRPAKATQYVVSFSVTNLRQIWKSNLAWYLPDKFAYPLATIPSASTPDYMSWFLSISHPILMNSDLSTFDRRNEMLSNLMDVMEPVADKGIPDNNLPPEWQIVLSTLLSTFVQYHNDLTRRTDI